MADLALTKAESLQKQLLERKKALMAEMIGIDDQLSRVARFIKDWHDFAGDSVAPLYHESVITHTSDKNKEASTHSEQGRVVQRSRPRNPPREEVAGAVREIIQERGEPVTRVDLFNELARRGLVIRGKDPEMVLSTMLWREKDRVVRVKGGGYWLVERDWPAGGYVANLTEPASNDPADDDLLV